MQSQDIKALTLLYESVSFEYFIHTELQVDADELKDSDIWLYRYLIVDLYAYLCKVGGGNKTPTELYSYLVAADKNNLKAPVTMLNKLEPLIENTPKGRDEIAQYWADFQSCYSGARTAIADLKRDLMHWFSDQISEDPDLFSDML